MTSKFQLTYRISSARALWHDYNEGIYFITICTTHHTHFFGEVRDGDMHLNELGMKAHENLQHLTDHYPYANIDVFQVMPNHVHLIVFIYKLNDSDGNNSGVVGCDDEQTIVRCGDEQTVARCGDCRDAARHDIEQNVVQCDICRDAARHVSTGETREPSKSDKMREIANNRGLLSVAMGGFKSAITRYANDNNIPFCWQTRFNDHIIRNAAEYERIALYIINNPNTWGKDEFNM